MLAFSACDTNHLLVSEHHNQEVTKYTTTIEEQSWTYRGLCMRDELAVTITLHYQKVTTQFTIRAQLFFILRCQRGRCEL
eukprot:5188135-Pyramimonas_sp.AAC.4